MRAISDAHLPTPVFKGFNEKFDQFCPARPIAASMARSTALGRRLSKSMIATHSGRMAIRIFVFSE
jgi:hypothetical protein